MEEFTGQLGERAIGVTNLMAKTLNITTGELFKRMQEGKIKPEDMLKLADAMGTFAESSAGYKAALNNSMSAQERMKNAWALFAYTVLESGLDEALVAIFTGLSALVQAITPVIKYLIGAAKGFIAMAKAVHAANLYLPIFIALMVLLHKQLLATFLMIMSLGFQVLAGWILKMPLAAATTAQLTGAVTALRVALNRLWPFLLLAGVIESWNAYDAYLRGERNWMNFLIGELMVLCSWFDLLAARVEYAYTVIKKSPQLGIRGVGQGIIDSTRDINQLTSPDNPFYEWDNLTQHEAQRRWREERWYRFIGSAPTFTPQQMIQDLGMGKGSTLNIVIREEKTGKLTQVPVDLTTGQVVTIPIGGAATK
jgi:hypothetical protein